MSKYAIYAYEGEYAGMHGINASEVVDLMDDKEAEGYALEMAQQVVEDFLNEEDFEEFDPEYCYTIYKISDDINVPIDELNNEFYNDMDGFIEKYHCKRID